MRHNDSRASKPASPLSSPTDYAERSIAAASTKDSDWLFIRRWAGARRELAAFNTTIVGTLLAATR
jgi:hypothetical protein